MFKIPSKWAAKLQNGIEFVYKEVATYKMVHNERKLYVQ